MEKIKNCSNCGISNADISFKGGQCKPCVNLKQRLYRDKTLNCCTKEYEKTPKGYLVRTYRNMLSRVTGVLKSKSHLYEGKEILTKEEFYEWSLNSEDFNLLFKDYLLSGFEPKKAPSIDRIDSTRGYSVDNIRWITHSENSRLGAISKHKGEQNGRKY